MSAQSGLFKGRGLSGVLSIAGSVVLFAMMLLTTADVACRYLFNSPLLGSLEITEFMVVVVVFCFLGITERERAHVRVDLVISRLPYRLRRTLVSATLLLSLTVMALITWMTMEWTLETYELGEYSSILHIPKAPFVFVVALGCLAMCLELARNLMHTVKGGSE